MAEEFSRQKDYHIAKIRGFKFLVEAENTSRGQKTALHEYPNRDDRFAEPLGKLPPILGLTCVIHGENYFQLRLDFEKILETPGVTELTHPVYGAIDVQPGPFTVTSNQREIGKFTFNVTFYTSVDGIGPAPIGFTSSTMSLFANACRFSLDNALEGTFLDPEDGFDLGKAVDAALGALDAVQDAIDSIVGPIESAIATVSSTINEFRSKIFRIAQTGSRLKNALSNLYNDILQLTLDPSTLSTAWTNLLPYNVETINSDGTKGPPAGSPGAPGSTGIPGRPGAPGTTSAVGPTNTEKRKRNETNSSVIDEHTRLTGLVGIMESLAFTEFSTADDIITTSVVVDERFNAYFQENEQIALSLENNPDVPTEGSGISGGGVSSGGGAAVAVTSLASDPDVRTAILQLKAGLRIVLDEQLANVWRTVEVDPGRSSMSLTAYRYYGDHETLENIIELNPDVNSANFDKEITLVTK